MVQASTGQVTAVGELYDVIRWLELPAFEEPLEPSVVRDVLGALSSYLNHSQLLSGKCFVFPSEESLAEAVERSVRTIRRVMRYLLRSGLVVLARAALRPGRNRKGRTALYMLPITAWLHWPQRPRNGSVTGDQSNLVRSPVSNGSATGDLTMPMVRTQTTEPTGMARSPVAAEPDHSAFNPAKGMNPAREPGHARDARESGPPGDEDTVELSGETAHQPSLPRTLTTVPRKRTREFFPDLARSVGPEAPPCVGCGGGTLKNAEGLCRACFEAGEQRHAASA